MRRRPDPYDPIVTRKPDPPPAYEPFICACCDRDVVASRWEAYWPRRAKPPMCISCEGHWANKISVKPRGITGGDHRALRRLSAITQRLNWEVINGRA